jgi:hypothetical protein
LAGGVDTSLAAVLQMPMASDQRIVPCADELCAAVLDLLTPPQ